MDHFWKISLKFYDKFIKNRIEILSENIFKIILIILISWIVTRTLKRIVRKLLYVNVNSPLRLSERREKTILKLVENIVGYAIYFIAFVMILSVVGIDVAALLAGAGIIGLAVGFGAQSLVKDVIAGFFIVLEDQFSVGDYVRINQFEGTVEEIGLRTSKIKSAGGERNIIPNGNILEVTNFSIHNSVAIVDISIALNEDISRVEEVIKSVLNKVDNDYEEVVKPAELLGIQSLVGSEMVLRILAETKPMKHWFIARIIRKEVKEALELNNISIAFPKMVLYSKEQL